MQEESIPLWKMYTPDMRGVRIRLPRIPFKKYKVSKGEYYSSQDFYTYINFKKHYDGDGYNISPIEEDSFLFNVEYTDNKELLFPNVVSKEDTATGYIKSINTKDIGRYKEKVWEFQKEWRYKLFIAPWTMNELRNVSSIEKQIDLFNRLQDYNLPFNHYDLELDEDKFKDMEILLGPKTSAAEEIIVRSLANEYNKDAKVIVSSLAIK